MSKYKDYIMRHRIGVIDTWTKVLRPILREDENIDSQTISDINYLVARHDESKLTELEYRPYSDHYLDPDNHPKDTLEYRRAWNHHQKTNPHHWQYWVLLEDVENPKVIPLEMEFKYVIEMLCDWQSASTYYGNTAHWWYETQKDNMQLHPKTRELIEHYLQYLN